MRRRYGLGNYQRDKQAEQDGPYPMDWRQGDAWLAGGTWLFSEPQPHLRRLIDLQNLGWQPLAITEASLEIAATCTIAELDGLSCLSTGALRH